MKVLSRINPTYKLSKLPKLKSNRFKHQGTIGYSGSIVRRRIKGPVKLYWHYAFIYGYDRKGRLLMIENNKDGVECVTLEDFNPEKGKVEVFHFAPNSDNLEAIIARAKKRSRYRYNPNENNCEHFVNYCIFEKLESIQTENTKAIANAAMLWAEMCIMNTPNADFVLEHSNKIRKRLGLERGSKELDKIVSNRINSFKSKSSKTTI